MMKAYIRIVIVVLSSCMTAHAVAGNEQTRQMRKNIRKGNSLFRANKRDEANVYYHKAYYADTTNAIATYNLSTSMFPLNWKEQTKEQLDTMKTYYLKAAQQEENPLRKSQSYYNVGVMFQNIKQFGLAIEAYKEALRNNPGDDEARYNLVLCQRQLKDEGQDQGGNNNEGNDKQQQDKEQQQQQEKKEQEQNQEQQEQQQQEPPMSKENAEQLLNAAIQQEKKTQQRMEKAQQQQSQHRRNEKNW